MKNVFSFGWIENTTGSILYKNKSCVSRRLKFRCAYLSPQQYDKEANCLLHGNFHYIYEQSLNISIVLSNVYKYLTSKGGAVIVLYVLPVQ